ncbi:MAG: helix-turn-helix domain-containing protein [Beutenbergiaceae bacterium]
MTVRIASFTTAAELGAIVRAARRERTLTQAELASTAGVSIRWLVALEAGKSDRVELGKVMATLRALGLQLLVGDRSDERPELSETERAVLAALEQGASDG